MSTPPKNDYCFFSFFLFLSEEDVESFHSSRVWPVSILVLCRWQCVGRKSFAGYKVCGFASVCCDCGWSLCFSKNFHCTSSNYSSNVAVASVFFFPSLQYLFPSFPSFHFPPLTLLLFLSLLWSQFLFFNILSSFVLFCFLWLSFVVIFSIFFPFSIFSFLLLSCPCTFPSALFLLLFPSPSFFLLFLTIFLFSLFLLFHWAPFHLFTLFSLFSFHLCSRLLISPLSSFAFTSSLFVFFSYFFLNFFPSHFFSPPLLIYLLLISLLSFSSPPLFLSGSLLLFFCSSPPFFLSFHFPLFSSPVSFSFSPSVSPCLSWGTESETSLLSGLMRMWDDSHLSLFFRQSE